MQPALLACSPTTLAARLGSDARAAAVFRALRAGRDPFTEGVLAEGARERLRQAARPSRVGIAAAQIGSDGTRKLLVELDDGHAVETVLIPTRSRTTVCVSTQVGCSRACRFCLTATLGRIRSLATDEIVAQLVLALAEVTQRGLPPLRNVVLMGMGEPLDNLEAVRPAVALMAETRGFGIGAGHVTLSTVGTTPSRILALTDLPARLAWSLHAVDDRVRRRLVPTTRHPMIALRDAFVEVTRARGDSIFIEMTLVAGINDSLTAAEDLARFLEPFDGRVRVNLLPMNAGREGLAPSPSPRVSAFQGALRQAGYFCMVRKARGDVQGSACGQLAGRSRPEP